MGWDESTNEASDVTRFEESGVKETVFRFAEGMALGVRVYGVISYPSRRLEETMAAALCTGL